MKYVIYARKSTEDEDRQVLSIEAQLFELKEFAAKEKLEIVGPTFVETKTAKEPGRMKFAEMLSFLEHGKADGIISWHPDRLERNSVDGGKIIHFVDKGYIKSLKFPTFWFEPTPQGLFMLSIAFGQSKYFVDSLRENVKRGLRQKVRRGGWPGKAPIGYLNERNMRKLVVNKDKAKWVKRVFEMYATGSYTVISLRNFLRERIKSNTNKPISFSMVHNMLTCPLYYGAMIYKGEYHLATHEPIISKKLFDKAEEVLNRRSKVHKVRKHDFAFLGLMKCASCGCSITGEKQKGHNYYRCTKKKEPCQEKHYLREESLIEQIKTFLQKVSLSSRDTKKVLAELQKDETTEKEKSVGVVQNLKTERVEIETKLEKLLDAYLGEVISANDYKSRKEKLLIQKVELNEKIRDFEQKGLSRLEPAREFVLSLNKAEKLLSTKNYPEMTTFLKNIGSNHILENRQFRFELKNPYDLVAERSEASPVDWTFPDWGPGQGSNLRPSP